jgi:hypothetical protein
VDTAHRICRTCHQSKHIDEFGTSNRHKDGKLTTCLVCCRKRGAAYRATHREELRLKSADYFATHREEHRQAVNAYAEVHREEIRAYWHANKEQRNLQRREKYADTPEQIRQRNKEWYHANSAHMQHYRDENIEKRRAETAQYQETHRKEIRAYQEAHREETRVRGRIWTRMFPEKNAAREQRRRARKQNLPDTWTQEQLAFMLTYWQQSCAVCGNMRGLLWTLAHDHWISIRSPECPGTVATNMIPLCHGDGGCNNSKSDTPPHEWLRRRFGPRKAAKIAKAIAAYFAQVALVFPESSHP